MDEKTPPVNESNPMQELGDALRPAVEQVRAAVPSAEAVARSVDRAEKLGPPPRRRSRRWLAWGAAAAAVAAVVILGYQLWPHPVQAPPEQVALHESQSALSTFMAQDKDKAPNSTSNTTRTETKKDATTNHYLDSTTANQFFAESGDRVAPTGAAGPPTSSGASGGRGGVPLGENRAKGAPASSTPAANKSVSGRSSITRDDSGRTNRRDIDGKVAADGKKAKYAPQAEGERLSEGDRAKAVDELKQAQELFEFRRKETVRFRELAEKKAIDVPRGR